ncbi:MAG: TMEM175 family protein [Cytophagales bacterium]|nr:TMEM175 family protein [Cytophagales bacterium]
MDKPFISTTRLEAFSDGVIAIIITIMVFDLKLNEVSSVEVLHQEFR